MRIGLIGCGRIAQVAHLPALVRVPELKLVGVMDVSTVLAAGVGEQYGCRAYTQLDQMLVETDPEAVIVAVPDQLHHQTATACLRAGADVLVDNSLSPSVQAAEELAATVAHTGRFLQVGAMNRHDPGLIYARQIINEEMGRVLSFTAWYRATSMRENITELYPPIVSDAWIGETERAFETDTGSNLLNTHGSHLWDTIRYLLADDVTSLTALRTDRLPDISWQVLMRTASGAAGTGDLTVNAHGAGSEGISVHCERGTLDLTTYVPFAKRASKVKVFRDATGEVSSPVLGYADPYERQLRSFMVAATAYRSGWAGVRASDELGLGVPATVADGVAVMRLLTAVEQSALDNSSQVIG